MPTVSFNSPFLSQMLIGATYAVTIGNLVTPTTLGTHGAPSPQSALSGGSAGETTLTIFKGTPASFPALTDVATRSSDVLITFSLPATTQSYSTTAAATGVRLVLGIAPQSTAAVLSGTASWFLLRRAGTTTLTNKGALLGTVGISGSGADLEVPDTNIVLGQSYRSNGVTLFFPFNRVF